MAWEQEKNVGHCGCPAMQRILAAILRSQPEIEPGKENLVRGQDQHVCVNEDERRFGLPLLLPSDRPPEDAGRRFNVKPRLFERGLAGSEKNKCKNLEKKTFFN